MFTPKGWFVTQCILFCLFAGRFAGYKILENMSYCVTCHGHKLIKNHKATYSFTILSNIDIDVLLDNKEYSTKINKSINNDDCTQKEIINVCSNNTYMLFL